MKAIVNRKKAKFFAIFCAVFALCVQISLAQTVENLAEQIKFGTNEVKRDALFQIRNLQTENASRFAVPALLDVEDIVRATAAFSVIYLPSDEAFNALAPNLKDKAEIVRRETAYALGKVQNLSAVPHLIQTFQNKKEKSIEVKNACIVALGDIGDVSAIDFLTQILQQKSSEKNEFLRRSAARAIGQIAQLVQIKETYAVTPESFLPDKYKLFVLENYANLSEKFPQFRNSVQLLIKILQNPKESADTKRETAYALGSIGDNISIRILQANLTNQDYYLVEICEESLIKLQKVSEIHLKTGEKEK